MLTDQELKKIRQEAEALYPDIPQVRISTIGVVQAYHEAKRQAHIAAVTAERERAKVIEEENALLKKRVEELCNDYNELAEQAAVWREESGN